MYKNILTKEQVQLIPVIKLFNRSFYLVGGTALALQIGHRRSVDFDLFSAKPISRTQIKSKLSKSNFTTEKILFEDSEQIHLLINGIKITFFHFPYNIPYSIKWDNTISMPGVLDSGAMKAYALGGRAKWKDYVDLFFILSKYHKYSEIVETAKWRIKWRIK